MHYTIEFSRQITDKEYFEKMFRNGALDPLMAICLLFGYIPFIQENRFLPGYELGHFDAENAQDQVAANELIAKHKHQIERDHGQHATYRFRYKRVSPIISE